MAGKRIIPGLANEHAQTLAYLAMLAAVEAPTKRGKYNFNASIPWRLIEEIRDTLRISGVPIDKTMAVADQLRRGK